MCMSSSTRMPMPSVRRWTRSGINVTSKPSRLPAVLCCAVLCPCCAVPVLRRAMLCCVSAAPCRAVLWPCMTQTHTEVTECLPASAAILNGMLATLCACACVCVCAMLSSVSQQHAMLAMHWCAVCATLCCIRLNAVFHCLAEVC